MFYDIIIRDAKINVSGKRSIIDIAIQFEEILVKDKVCFSPKIRDFGDLTQFYAHKTLKADKQYVIFNDNISLEMGSAIDFVMINNKLFSLKSINN